MLVYIYDGSFEGILTSVFEAYARKEAPDKIVEESGQQLGFGQQTRYIETDSRKALRVERGITDKAGQQAYQHVWVASLSCDMDKATAIYRYICRCLEIRFKIYNDLANPDVIGLLKVYNQVAREGHALTEFLRFSQMEGGVFYAKITPDHYVIPILMPHFVERYCVQPFIIHDKTHQTAGVYDLKEWYMVDAANITLPDESCDELAFRRMWKMFYETIAVKERINLKCRQSFMPKKYWQNMTEMNFIETPKTKAQDQRNINPKFCNSSLDSNQNIAPGIK